MDTVYVIVKRTELNGYYHNRYVAIVDMDVRYTRFADEATTFFSEWEALNVARERGLFGYEIAEGKIVNDKVTKWAVIMEVKEDVD